MTLIAFCKHCNAPLGGGHFAGCPERETAAEYEPTDDEIKAAVDAFYDWDKMQSATVEICMTAALKAAHAIREVDQGMREDQFDAKARGQWERIRAQGFAEGMEAAAKIADGLGWAPNPRGISDYGQGSRDAAEKIAFAIREAAKTKGPSNG